MKKIHKLDLILLVGLALIAIVSALIDIFYVVVFPVYSCASAFYASFPLWLILFIYSLNKYTDKKEEEKPLFVKWYTVFFFTVSTCCVFNSRLYPRYRVEKLVSAIIFT